MIARAPRANQFFRLHWNAVGRRSAGACLPQAGLSAFLCLDFIQRRGISADAGATVAARWANQRHRKVAHGLRSAQEFATLTREAVGSGTVIKGGSSLHVDGLSASKKCIRSQHRNSHEDSDGYHYGVR